LKFSAGFLHQQVSLLILWNKYIPWNVSWSQLLLIAQEQLLMTVQNIFEVIVFESGWRGVKEN
jgi:hypothetical protein